MNEPTRRPRFRTMTALALTMLFAAAGDPAAEAADPTDGGSRELIVLLAPPPDAPEIDEVLSAHRLGEALPAPLYLGAPVAVRPLVAERPAQHSALLDFPPDSPEALLLRYLVVTYPPVADLEGIEIQLEADPAVMHVSVNRTLELSGSPPNDPLFSLQWGLTSLHLPEAWERTTGHGYVGVVDTGIDTTHPDLAAFDGAGNYLGGNFRRQLSRDYGYYDDNVDEGQPQIENGQLRQVARAGHGTHVAGIVGATTDNGIGVTGVCPHCSLIVAKVSRLRLTSVGWANTSLSDENSAEGIQGAVGRGAQVLNLSYGARGSCVDDCAEDPLQPECVALDLADRRDVVVVAASGNDGAATIDHPASEPSVLAAGGIEAWGELWADCTTPPPACTHRECGSNHDPGQLVTPAKEVISTFYRGIPYSPSFGCDDSLLPGFPGYGPCTGTSMSAPHLSGSVGLLRSINPLLSRHDIESLLRANLDNPPGWDPQHGDGKPDIEAASAVTLGVARGQTLPNRLTPLFTAYSTFAQAHFYSSVPQMMTAAFFDPVAPSLPGEGPSTPGYLEFPGTACQVSPCTDYSPRASVYLFTTGAPPAPGAAPLVPLYRMSFKGPWGGNPLNRSYFWTTETAGLERGWDIGYELDGREGYIHPRCATEPACIPAGAVRLYRLYHFGRDDYAIFPESELPAFLALGYVSQPGLNDWIGYVYPNQDSDGDELIDGFELLAGTDPAVADSDCDGATDGDEVNGFPYGDPLDGICGSIDASPDRLVIPVGQLGTSTVTWSTSGTPTAQVWVKVDNGNEVVTAQSPAGSSDAPWIQRNRTYEFLLFAGTERAELLDYATVFGLAAGGGQITAYPRPVSGPAGSLGTTRVQWATDGLATAEVWVSRDGLPEVPMARAPAGSGDAGWIVPGRTYTFRLYAGTGHSVLLDTVVVAGVVEN